MMCMIKNKKYELRAHMDDMHFGLSLFKTELSYTRVFEILVSDYHFFCKNICKVISSPLRWGSLRTLMTQVARTL